MVSRSWSVLVLASLLAGLPAWAGEDEARIAGWGVRTTSFTTEEWWGVASPVAGGETARIGVGDVRPPRWRLGEARTIDVAGVGPVTASMVTDAWRVGIPSSSGGDRHPELVLVLVKEHAATRLVVTANVAYEPTLEDAPDADADAVRRVLRAARRALAEVEQHPAFLLFVEIARGRGLGARMAVATQVRSIEVAIDGGPYVTLAEASRSAEGSRLWVLPARPGQAVRFRVAIRCQGYEATSEGVAPVAGPIRERIELRFGSTRVLVDEHGQAEGVVPTLESPRALGFSITPFGNPGFRLLGALHLRYGRPEEAWLDDGRFPLSPPLGAPTLEAAREALLDDLASGFDPDDERFRDRWGVSEVHGALRVRPWSYRDAASLAACDLTRRPVLQRVLRDATVVLWLGGMGRSNAALGNPGAGTLDEATALHNLRALTVSRRATPLWKPRRDGPSPDAPSGWHDPRAVHLLAALEERLPSLGDESVVRRVLDFWVASMPQHEDPSGAAWHASFSRGCAPFDRAHALAALHAGVRRFGARYRPARDRQLDLLRRTFLEATAPGTRWTSRRDWDGVVESVAAYGQACALVGDEPGLAEARDWIRRMLERATGDAHAAYACYRGAPFGLRAALLAVIRGEAAYARVP